MKRESRCSLKESKLGALAEEYCLLNKTKSSLLHKRNAGSETEK